MRRLSRPITDLEERYDVVVVGSGYGGGIAASRLARAGLRVCVLERGREFGAGEFPDRLSEAQPEFQISENILGDARVGGRDALYNLRLGRDMHVFSGCGLGGTSLVNAGVALHPDPRVFDDPVWPEGIKDDPAWAEGLRRATRMLRPAAYPAHKSVKKLEALETAGQALGRPAERPPILVTFESQVNAAGVEQPACADCGDCCSGCNVGAKNTVYVTYLADAVDHGAAIFTQIEARSLRREADGWTVLFDLLGQGRERFDAPEQAVRARIVVLAAGTLGSTEILLRSRERGLALSQRLGERFTGNGDALAFAYAGDAEVNGVGVGDPPCATTEPVGPCITGLIDLRGTPRLDDGMVIEEGALPSALASVLPGLFAAGAALGGRRADDSLGAIVQETERSLESLVGGAYAGAIHSTQTFLVMAHDDSGGRIALEGGDAVVHWPDAGRQPVFGAVEKTLEAAAAATGGAYIRNPLQETAFGGAPITVHPLGGCVMGRDRETGVVNHKGQAYDGDPAAGAQAVHPGLYVCDGSVIPRSLGVNPLMTISGLAERAMIHLASDYGLRFDDAPRADAPRTFAGRESGGSRPAGVEFTERMAGYVSFEDAPDYESAERAGRSRNSRFSFTVTVVIEDIEAFAADPEHTGAITGAALCPALSPEPLTITSGTFNLLRPDPKAAETRRFDYRLRLTARDGQSYWFEGFKLAHSDAGLDLWSDATRLFVDIWREGDRKGRPIGSGLLTISLADFLTQMRTVKGLGGADALDRLGAVARFGGLFVGALYDIYGGVFAPGRRFDPALARKKRELRAGPPEVHAVRTGDGKTLRLTRYKGGDKGPVILSHGLGVSSLIFSLDTIDENLTEHLFAAGYDCWLLDYRASVTLPYCREQWTADAVAKYDYPAAVGKVRAVTGRSTVQMLAHCFGSTTFFMAMLAGLEGVRSAVASQVAMDMVVPWWPQRLLAEVDMPALFEVMGFGVVDARATVADGPARRLLDAALWPALTLSGRHPANSATSNRITALYGQLYEYEQLNRDTMDKAMPLMFGEANITAFKHLALMVRQGHIVAYDGEERYLPHLDRLKLPLLFIHGAKNACFLPRSTEQTLMRLARAHGPSFYDRRVISGYGHIDCIFGRDAARDVYPHIRRGLEQTAAG